MVFSAINSYVVLKFFVIPQTFWNCKFSLFKRLSSSDSHIITSTKIHDKKHVKVEIPKIRLPRNFEKQKMSLNVILQKY